MITNDCPIERYATAKDAASANTHVYDLVISGLPQDAKPEHVRQIASAKHVVEAIVDHDTIRNICTGNAKLRVRLGDGEDIDTVITNFLRAGLSVQVAKSNPNKKPVFTYQ